jgi:membrane protease YdiL (CAAX protease family)
MGVRMNEQSLGALPENPARAHFHLVLALILVPCAAAGAGIFLALSNAFRADPSGAQRKWTRLLAGLALVDLLVVASGAWLYLHAEEIQRRAPLSRRRVIGAQFENETSLKVREVLPNLPGERAGLAVGDVVLKIDGTKVATVRELSDALQDPSAEERRTLTLRRDGELFELTVTPEAPPRAPKVGLFEVRSAPEARAAGGALLAFAPAGLLVGLLALRTRLKFRSTVPVWSGFVLASLGSFGLSAAALYLGKALLGGWSLGLILISLLVQMAAMLLLTRVARRWLSREIEPSPCFRSPLRAGLQGLFYLVTGIPRVGILLAMADQFLFRGQGMGEQSLKELASSPLGVAGTLLFVVNVVLLGPLAEETLFRGFLLPRLAVQWGETVALAASSLVFALFHPHYGPYMPMVFLYGWVFGWARLGSGSIVASTGLHMAVNGFVTALVFLKG